MARALAGLFNASVNTGVAATPVIIEPSPLMFTNDQAGHMIARFADAASDAGIGGDLVIPNIETAITTVQVVINLTFNATSGNFEFVFRYRAIGGDDAESSDPSSWQETVASGAEAAPTSAFNNLRIVLALTASNFAVNDVAQFQLYRDNDGGNDTIAADALVSMPGTYLEVIG